MTGWNWIRVSRSRLGSKSSSRTVHLGRVQPQHLACLKIRCNDRDANLLTQFKGSSISNIMARSLSNLVLKGITRFQDTCSLRATVASRTYFQHYMRHSTTVTGDPDTHDDFKPTNKLAGSDLSTQDIVEQDVKENPVMLYMKGVPDAPRCGFSALAVRILNEYSVPISARNILEDPELKNGVKAFSNWPTFPQIFIKGEFIGGSDIILNMHQTGELKEKLKDISANQEKEE